MAKTTCLFWIKFFIWIFASGGIGMVFTFFGLNQIISFVLSFIIASPILFADYIVNNFIEKNKKRKRKEKGKLKQEMLENIEYNENNIVLCPKCDKKNLIGTTHCSFCGKDLRVITQSS